MNDFNPHHKGALQGLFDTARREVTGETLEQIRDNYYIAAKMRGCDDSSVGGLNINSSGRRNAAVLEQKKRDQATNDMIFMSLLDDRLSTLEEAMTNKYGEDFAEQLAAEILDEETYKSLMQIEDPEERRRAIAKAINDGTANGTIDPDEVDKNPDFKEWLDTHAEKFQQMEANAHSGVITKNDLTADSTEDASLDKFFAQDVTLS